MREYPLEDLLKSNQISQKNRKASLLKKNKNILSNKKILFHLKMGVGGVPPFQNGGTPIITWGYPHYKMGVPPKSFSINVSQIF